MAAPALMALAHGSRDPRSAATIKALVDEVTQAAPRPAGRDGVPRAVQAVASTRWSTSSSRRGFDEIVVVPLLLTDAYHAKVDVPAAVAEADARHAGLAVRATSILGLEPCFLEVLDVRMREALSAARVRELDALVLAAAGSSDPLANQSVARLARLWGTHHKLPVTRGVRLGGSRRPPARPCAPSASEGRRHIAVASLFLAPGLPARPGRGARARGRRRRRRRAARRPPEAVARTILARYAVGAVELVPV